MCDADTAPGSEQPDLALLVNFAVSDAIRLAPADAEHAAKVLMLAADLLRNRQPLPYQLADYLADAFEAAMSKQPDARVRELAFELNLQARNKRPSVNDWVAIFQIMQANPDCNDTAIVKLFMDETGCSDKHARRRLAEAKEAQAKSAKVDREDWNQDQTQ